LFPTDHSTVRQVLVADTMLLYLKENFYFSRNEGGAFVQSNDHPRNFEDLFYKYYLPNQAVYDKGEKIVYLCTTNGLEKSSNNGENFSPESNYAPGSPPINPTSITQTENGNLYMIQDFDDIYEKQPGGAWTKIGITQPLPTDTTTWYITNKFNMLLAVDYNGWSGIYYSLDAGVTWNPCTGLPLNRKILFGKQPLSNNNSYFTGLDSGGLYRLNGINFEASGQGIPWYAKVHFVIGKRLVYRTNVERYYHFCATDLGLYISENDGRDWRLIRSGVYSTLF